MQCGGLIAGATGMCMLDFDDWMLLIAFFGKAFL